MQQTRDFPLLKSALDFFTRKIFLNDKYIAKKKLYTACQHTHLKKATKPSCFQHIAIVIILIK